MACPFSRIWLPYEVVAVPKLQVPALVTRLPPLPAIRIEPSGDNDVVDGVAELVGLVVATQPEPVHSDHCPSELSVYRLPLATSSSVPYPAHADCPLSRIRFPP